MGIDQAKLHDSDSERSDEQYQYLTFMLNGEEYGIDILKIRGIQGWESVTPILNTPKHILGVINIRGDIVPIVDLRLRFNMEKLGVTNTMVIIVVTVEVNNKHRVIGLVGDAVSEVYDVLGKQIQAPPALGDGVDVEFVRGIVASEEKLITLLEVEKLIDVDAIDTNSGQL